MTTYSANDWVVEPCNVAIVNCVTSINTANIPGFSCEGKSETIVEDTTELKGHIKLEAGFNCAITERNNVFTIESIQGGGACLTETYCTGNILNIDNECVLCNETIKAINGVNGKTIRIKGGPGVTVVPKEKVPHTLVITLNTQQFKNGCEVNNESEATSTD